MFGYQEMIYIFSHQCTIFNLNIVLHSLTHAQWLVLVGNQYLSIACSNRMIMIAEFQLVVYWCRAQNKNWKLTGRMANQIQNWSDILNDCPAICDEHMHFLRPKGCHIHADLLEGTCCSVQYRQVVQPTTDKGNCGEYPHTNTWELPPLTPLWLVWLRWAAHVLQLTLLWLYVGQGMPLC